MQAVCSREHSGEWLQPDRMRMKSLLSTTSISLRESISFRESISLPPTKDAVIPLAAAEDDADILARARPALRDAAKAALYRFLPSSSRFDNLNMKFALPSRFRTLSFIRIAESYSQCNEEYEVMTNEILERKWRIYIIAFFLSASVLPESSPLLALISLESKAFQPNRARD